jgi:DNA repair exonuclease SbcCD ATPase subunit
MIGFLKGLASLRNVAILAGLLAAAFAAQSLRIKWKDGKIDRLETKLINMIALKDTWKHRHTQALEANQTNQTIIAELQQTNQQCAQARELNEQRAAEQTRQHQGRIADIKAKYDELRKKLPQLGCANTVIDDSVLDLLYKD